MKVGRPKGSKNKSTAEVRAKFQELIENNLSQFQDDLNSLEPLERLNILLKLSKFVLPTLKATDIVEDTKNVLEISFYDPEKKEYETISTDTDKFRITDIYNPDRVKQ
ncbi:hypothetical protein [Aequorivita viscosa]|uniref:Uncharacterized protein n=1 Tax=Aequorivita viscosa TaxID=797419 RepID=A0A1M6KK41_9FLAO|nr:hypothetical protein [Aequorivita viscosa]SDX19361.1 hypothetical protein SAMN05216556_12010 [Aequorivita viscosa]SHJ59324.1 hypothetical protein SAMN04487908_12062 [Aequorivita viscosa]